MCDGGFAPKVNSRHLNDMVRCSYIDIHIVKLTLYYNNKTYNALLRKITVVIFSKGVGLFLFDDKN